MNIAVVGTGYVGLVTGTCLAEMGNVVTCVDIDVEKVNMLNGGELSIYEPDLEVLFKRNCEQARLIFTTDLSLAVKNSTVIFLALPTPSDEDGSADLSYILDVANNLGNLIDEYKVIVDKSTVPVGTAEKVKDAIAVNTDVNFDVVSNPEFLREGVAVEDFMKPDRVVIGVDSDKARDIMEKIYKPYVRQGNPIIFMDTRSAELTKYTANAYLATRISFINEISDICARVGADVDMVRMGIGSDFRIGKHFLFPGIGYGGSCFPKDVKALSKIASDADYDFKILKAVMAINQQQREVLFTNIKEYFKGSLKGKKIAVWGLSFKPNTDDIREAPSIYLLDKMIEEGAEITAFDPAAMAHIEKLYGDKITLADNQYDILNNADALMIITEWSVFRTPDFDKMKSLMASNVIFDGRNLYVVEDMESYGFYYFSIGRRLVNPLVKISSDN